MHAAPARRAGGVAKSQTIPIMIVTIDGPAGAGKSTVARALAERLGFDYLDTGAMYRAVALAGMRNGVDWNRPEQLEALLPALRITFRQGRIHLDGEDVSDAIRTSQVTAVTRFAADNPQVRKTLAAMQRDMAHGRSLITEGRDQGTFVFPEADCKIYLSASPAERARRRFTELTQKGEHVSQEEILRQIVDRDRRDENRPVGPLAKAADAILVDTDGLSVEQVVDRISTLVRACAEDSPES